MQHTAAYPPDAARGIDIAPAFSEVLATLPPTPRSRTKHFTLPAVSPSPFPDQSMPFNVIAIACTVAAFCVGSLFNLLASSDKDFALLQRTTKSAKLVAYCRSRCQTHGSMNTTQERHIPHATAPFPAPVTSADSSAS